MKIPVWADDFVSILFPRVCLACERSLPRGMDTICVQCQFKIQKTHYHEHIENPLTNKFIGYKNLRYATAFYFYDDYAKPLIHRLKYKDRPDIGEKIGNLYGKILKDTHFEEIDTIVPVPLHPKKMKLRGYNQSEVFANGLAETMEKEVLLGLERAVFTETQTKKGKWERLNNVESVFVVTNRAALEGKHILLVDDVLTTGSTLSACLEELSSIEGVKISIAAIAAAKK